MENTPREEETAVPEQAPPSSRADSPSAWRRLRAWRRFRAWRRGRPFWGGLLAILAGVEIYASQQTSVGDIIVKVGVEGFQAYLIPLMLIVAGLLAWFSPAQRFFYGVIACFVAVYALIGVNFGGWIVGTLLGMIGGALIFSWTPVQPAPTNGDGEAADQADETSDQTGEEPEDDEHAPRHAVTDELFGGPDVPVQRGSEPDRSRGRLLAITLVPLLMAAIGVAAVRGTPAAYAACPTPTRTTTSTPKPPASTSPAASATPSSPKASPSASPSPSTGLLGQIITGIEDLFDPNDPSASISPSVSASVMEATSSAPKVAAVSPTPSRSAKTRSTASPCPSASASASPSPSPAKRLQAAAGQSNITAKPSRMTGSIVTMEKLVFQGVVDLPTADGPITVLKFTMDSSVTDDFVLHTYGRGKSPDIDFITDKLTVKENVAFYASRFQGNLLGLLPVDYTPTNLPPPIPELPFPIWFTDPDIQLVWVNSDVLTAQPSLLSKVA